MNNLRDTAQLKKFGNWLKVLRTQRKLTLEQLAFAADIELSQVHRIEQGKINPTYTTLLALATGLDIPVHDLVHIVESTTE